LTQGQWAIVDAADYDWLMQWKWHVQQAHTAHVLYFYAVRDDYSVDGKRRFVFMHRVLLGLNFGDKRKGDHRNHNTLDNTHVNLRIASNTQNLQNQKIHPSHPTGCKGVDIRRGRYRVRIRIKGIRRHLGEFSFDPAGLQAASDAYAKAAREHFGEFFYER
jgi:hypothetical protein